MKLQRRTLTGILLGLVISAVALWLVFRWVGWQALERVLREVHYGYLGLAVIILLVSMVARAACWRTLLGGSVSIWRTLAALNEGYLLNNLLPWRMGELGRAILLGRRPGMSVIGVMSSILLERLYDITIALSLLISLLPFAVGLQGAMRGALLGVVVVLGAIAFLWIAFHRSAWIERWLVKLPGGSVRWRPLWFRFRDGLEAVRSPRLLAISFAWMMVSWALAGLYYWLVLRSVLPDANLLWAFFMLTVTLLGIAVPSSPGYIGVFEAMGVLALSVFGVASEQALAATLVLHGLVFFITSFLGALALVSDGETLSGLYRQVRGWMATTTIQQGG